MSSELGPLVSVLTPVYNGAEYLAECIESVLSQTYSHLEYLIVNNCSTDTTLDIARSYEKLDARIRVHDFREFVGVIENHNRAFCLISPQSKYCKVLSADDRLFPECIEKLVEVAECNPRVGIVGSYAIHDQGFRRVGLPLERSIFEGREVCRLYLLGVIGALGAPSTLLYRSSLVRSSKTFYPGSLPNGDLAACLACLGEADFAFVHQILCYERIHNESLSADLGGLLSFQIDTLQFLSEYGPQYLDSQEINRKRQELVHEIYDGLAEGAVHLRRNPSWKYQRARLASLGYPVNDRGIAMAICMRVADLLLNPKQTVERIMRRRKRRAFVHQPEQGNTLPPRAVGPVIGRFGRPPVVSLPQPTIGAQPRPELREQ